MRYMSLMTHREPLSDHSKDPARDNAGRARNIMGSVGSGFRRHEVCIQITYGKSELRMTVSIWYGNPGMDFQVVEFHTVSHR
jgi:hypothetical protein